MMPRISKAGLMAPLLALGLAACVFDVPAIPTPPEIDPQNNDPNTPRIGDCVLLPGSDCSGADLSGADLSGLSLARIDLSGANLSATVFNGADLTNASLRGANAEGGRFSDAALDNVDLSRAVLSGATLEGASMEGADLSGVEWLGTTCPDGTNSDNNGDTCGGHLTDLLELCYIAPGAQCRGVDLAGANLDFANLTDADLEGADLQGARLTKAVLERTNLDLADLAGAVMQDANATFVSLFGAGWGDTICPDGTNSDNNGDTCGGHLTDLLDRCDARPEAECTDFLDIGSNLAFANLERATIAGPLDSADLRGANLKNATLGLGENEPISASMAFFERADLTGANLIGANFSSSDLSGTDFAGAAMEAANLSGANLTGANFENADLLGVVVLGATLVGANFRGATFFEREGRFFDCFPLDETSSPDELQCVGLFEGPSTAVWVNTICPDGTNSDDNGLSCGGHMETTAIEACHIGPQAQCAGADLSRALMADANLFGADLSGADLSGANLNNANLSTASLVGADLRGTYLFSSDLSGADVAGARLRGALFSPETRLPAGLDPGRESMLGPFVDLGGADLSGMDMTLADLTGANLVGADITDVIWRSTTCPDGTNSDDNGSTCEGHL